jgi:hypothetical protein
MGQARNSGSGSWGSKWKQRKRTAAAANATKGVPIPGTGRWHWHKRPSGSNRSGVLSHGNMEWGATNRKHEDAERNLNNTARRQVLAEQIADLDADGYDVDWLDELDADLRAATDWERIGDTWVEIDYDYEYDYYAGTAYERDDD